MQKGKEMILPSKELISEVLSKEVEEERFIDSNSLTYVNSGIYEDINIYELAHKCKEWALRKGYIVASGLNEEGRWWCDVSEVKIFPAINCTYVQDTEMEAVIKACEWIMEQTKCGS